jgi:hypothetical protein
VGNDLILSYEAALYKSVPKATCVMTSAATIAAAIIAAAVMQPGSDRIAVVT